ELPDDLYFFAPRFKRGLQRSDPSWISLKQVNKPRLLDDAKRKVSLSGSHIDHDVAFLHIKFTGEIPVGRTAVLFKKKAVEVLLRLRNAATVFIIQFLPFPKHIVKAVSGIAQNFNVSGLVFVRKSIRKDGNIIIPQVFQNVLLIPWNAFVRN